jgi:hypothetical protein
LIVLIAIWSNYLSQKGILWISFKV